MKLQKMSKKEYQEFVGQRAPKSHLLRDCLRAFWVGGLICLIGQAFSDLGSEILMLSEEQTADFTVTVMVFLGATLTGLGLYAKIGKYAGAGSIVPVTGFANSVVSPAIEFKQEGFVMGVGAKMFTVAGPIIVYGVCASVAVGILAVLIGGMV